MTLGRHQCSGCCLNHVGEDRKYFHIVEDPLNPASRSVRPAADRGKARGELGCTGYHSAVVGQRSIGFVVSVLQHILSGLDLCSSPLLDSGPVALDHNTSASL